MQDFSFNYECNPLNVLFGTCAITESEVIIDSKADVLKSAENMKRTEILEKYGEQGTVRKTIWFAEKEGYWYWSKPDSTKKNGHTNVKRKKKDAIENLLCDYYMELEKKQQETEQQNNMTLEALFYEFMEHKKELVKASTVKRMIADWERFYTDYPEFIHKPYKDITKIDIDNFFNSVVNKQTLKDKAFRNMCGLLKQTFEYAVDAEYIEKSPYRVNVSKKKIVPTRKGSNAKEVFLPEEQEMLKQEMERRLRNNPSNTATLAVLLDFELGVRSGELLAIRESNISDGKIHICQQVVERFSDNISNMKSTGFEVVDYTKSECGDRWLPLTDRAMELIKRIKNINKEYNLEYKDYLFVRDNHIMYPDALNSQLTDGCEYLGIPVRTMHKIRKTYASMLYKKGVPIPTISKLLGHADESTTFKHYIFSLDSNDETDKLVLDALQGTNEEENIIDNVRQRESKILLFPANKKAENPSKLRAFH